MDHRTALAAILTLWAPAAFAQTAAPDFERSLQAALERAWQAEVPSVPAAKASRDASGKASRVSVGGEFLISVLPAEPDNKVVPSKAWLDLVFTGNDRFKVKFSFDPRSILLAEPARKALREDPDLRQAVEMGIQLKLAAARGIADPSLIRVPAEALDAAVANFVDSKINREAALVASVQGLSVELNLLKGGDDGPRVDAEVGKIAPAYFDRTDYFHFRIPENAVRVTTAFGDRVKVYFETYKSRFPNLDERVIEDYIKTVVSQEDVSRFADVRANAVEAGISFGDTLVALGRRRHDAFYGVFQHERSLGGGFTGSAQLTLEKGSAAEAADGSLIKRLNAMLERSFGKVEAYGQFFARRSLELSQPNVTAAIAGASYPLTKHLDAGANVGRVNGGALYEFTGRLHF